MKRIGFYRWYPGVTVVDAQMRRRGFRVLRIGPYRLTWCKHPGEWRF